MALVGGCQHPFARSRQGLIRNGRLDSCCSLACLGCFGSPCTTIPNLFSKSHDGALSFHSTRTRSDDCCIIYNGWIAHIDSHTPCAVDVFSCCSVFGWIWSVSVGWDVLLAFLIRGGCSSQAIQRQYVGLPSCLHCFRNTPHVDVDCFFVGL